ncbi:hypothetical protein ACTFIY_004880 [Dictyostelium cf. discoideum]
MNNQGGAVAANGQRPQAQQQQQQGGIMGIISTLIRFMAIYYIASFAFSKFLGTSNNNNNGSVVLNNNNGSGTNASIPSNSVRLANSWPEGIEFNMKIYLSTSNETVGDWLVWEQDKLSYDWEDSNTIPTKNITFDTTPYLQNNGSLFAHIITSRRAYLNQPKSQLHKVHPLIVYLPKPKPKGKNLLEEKSKDEPEVEYDPTELISYWKPTLSLHLIVDHTIYPPDSIPKEIVSYFNITNGFYSPIIYCNEFWLYREHLKPVNETVKQLSIEISYSSMGLFKWQLQIQMQKSLDMQESFGGGGGSAMGGASVGDEFKRMLTDNDPWILGLTLVVSVLHTIFEFLAFKNDIQFWKNNKSMEGLSVKTITLNCVCMGIIFLYLLDNETSYMILASSGFGFLVEFWKLGKAMTIKITWMTSLPLPKRIEFINKDEYMSKTKQYDDMAMKYLSWLLFPLVVGTSIYSLYYHEHKSWYSWVVSSLVRTVYTFEFIMMTPQLFINYKLKSVSHLPWRVFMYRALNTFIDDLFAFIIKMPLLHRLSCLRDDIIFIVYLYQRWIYPVDKKRSHYGSEEAEEVEVEKIQDKKEIKEKVEEEEKEKEKVEEEEEKEEESTSSSKVTKRKTKKV